jgi:hypothetical protein
MSAIAKVSRRDAAFDCRLKSDVAYSVDEVVQREYFAFAQSEQVFRAALKTHNRR